MQKEIRQKILGKAFRKNIEAVAIGLRTKLGLSQDDAFKEARKIVKLTWKQEAKAIRRNLNASRS